MPRVRIIHLSSSMKSVDIMAKWAHEKWFAPHNISYNAVLKDYRKRCNVNSLPSAFVAKDEIRTCGMVSLKQFDLLSRKDLSPWLSSLYVLPEYRKKGVGSALVRVCEKEAERLGYSEMFLFVDYRDSAHLEKYYTSLGWFSYSDEVDSFGHSVKVMRKKL
ncbi:MAG: GNAT family N-acetyltransferase [Spirochaetes bacterium]|nr:GNAT family N-acetyltransferase [Spirochaetota bacterium]MBP9023897.1 GNAT family N-acetyltransferase [Spirochaetota bacterium]